MLYHLSERNDGRIVLDREPRGFVLQSIEVDEPEAVRRLVGEKWIDVPQYHESFSAARALAKEKGIFQTVEGWFRQESARLDYVRGRLGESD